MAMNLFLVLVFASALPAKTERINLVDFARVVRYEGDSPETLEVRGLERGVDGWDAWPGPGGQYMIGVEWDEPRELAEVNIEFRHAIANREEIRVQYWHHHWPSNTKGGWADLDDPFHGEWVTAKAEWWAGDRDVTFAFAPYNEEQPSRPNKKMRYRQTYRLRFLCGTAQLPPVRYLRAYGPGKAVEGTFDLKFSSDGSLRPPMAVSILNGKFLEEEDGKTTTTQSTRLEKTGDALRILYADGDQDTPTRTIVTLRDDQKPGQGFSFLPAEVVKRGRIHIAPLGVRVLHHGVGEPSPPPAQATYYDRIAREPEQTWERARREIPALEKTKQTGEPLYLPLGPPHSRQEIGVSYDGSVLLDQSALKVPAADDERLKWPGRRWYIKLRAGKDFEQGAEGAVKQRLLEGYLPIVINSWETGGVRYEQTCVATYLDGEPREPRGDETVVLLSRIVAKNAGPQPARAGLRFHLESGEEIALDGHHVYARGSRKNDKLTAYDSMQHRFSVVTPSEDGADVSVEGDHTVACEIPLQSGTSGQVDWVVPFVPLQSEAERGRAIELASRFEAVLESEAGRWRKIIAGQAEIEAPDALLNDFYKANLAHIFITSDRDPFNGTVVLPAATYGYNVCLNEACHQIRALEIRGLHSDAQKYLDAIVAGQSSQGMHGRFTDKDGVLHGLPSRNGNYQTFRYNLDHGFALWMLGEHYKFTRDRDWLGKVADAMIQACDFVTRQRTKPGPEGHTLAEEDTYWGRGLLPPGHLEDPPEWLWWFAVNAYAYRGMQIAAEVLGEIEHPEARRIAGDAEEYGVRLRRSCEEAMVRAPVTAHPDGTHWPFQPTRSRLRGRDLGWIRDVLYGPVHLIDCGVYAYDSPQAEWILRDAENNVFLSPEWGRDLKDPSLWFSWGGITIQSNLLPNPLVYLHRGQGKYAVRAFWNSLAANVYEDVRTFTEHPVEAYGLGRGPFFKSPDESAFIVWLRHLLVMESGRDLDLLAGVPKAWLEPGKKIRVKNAATWFGPMSIEVESTNTELVVRLSPPNRNAIGRIRLHNRRGGKVSAVTMGGSPASDYDAANGVLTLANKTQEATIVFEY